MKQIEKTRRSLVMLFIMLGLIAGLYEIVTAPPVYDGVADGFMGMIKLKVTVKNEEIKAIKIIEHSETPGISDPAFQELIPNIIKTQNLNIDNIAGATYTSMAIKKAIQSAMIQAGVELKVEEPVAEKFVTGRGVEGKGEGYLDEIKVEIEMQGDLISNIWVTYHNDTESIAEPAFKKLKDTIIEKQTTDVDMVAGATWTSEGYVEAVKDALKNTKK